MLHHTVQSKYSSKSVIEICKFFDLAKNHQDVLDFIEILPFVMM